MFSFIGCSQNDPATETFDLRECQEELTEFFLERKGKVNLHPCKPDEVAEMESIFVELELVGKQTTRSSGELRKIESNDALVNLKSCQGQRANRVLVMGEAGCGKSTMVDNIAYKWAKQAHASPLSKFSLVFMISVNEIQDSKASLVDLIFDQILPEDTRVSKEGLKSFITSNAKDILLLVDGMDEDSSGSLKNKSSEITKILHYRKLRKSCVILTTRSHTIDDLGDHLRNYTQVILRGFSLQSIELFINYFFQGSQENGQKLLTRLHQEPHVMVMASIPVLLLMICLLWEDQCTLPKTKTKLYQATINFLWKRYHSKVGERPPQDDHSDDEEFEDDLKILIKTLGQVSLSSYRQHGRCHFNMTFTESDLGADTFSKGCKLGIISKKHL